MNRPEFDSPRLSAYGYTAFVVLFLLLPIALGTVVAFSSGDRLEFPLPGFSLRWFQEAWRNVQFVDGLWNSLIIAVCSAALATIAGTGAAIALSVIVSLAALAALLLLPANAARQEVP